MAQKYKIAIVGPREAILGFKAVGLEPVNASSTEEAVTALYELKKARVEEVGDSYNKYAIVFIMEDVAKEISDDDYKKLTKDPLPALISLPSLHGSTGFGMARLKSIVEKAVGMDILN